MNKVLVLQHVPFELLGTLNPLFKKSGHRIRYINFGRHPEAEADVSRYDAMVILGGPASVNSRDKIPHLNTEIEMIKKAIELNIPVLGICLGAQLIAAALGADIKKNPEPEIGWYDVQRTSAGAIDPMISNFSESEKIFQWHNDTFMLPDGATLLASTSTCKNQAFRYKDNVYGLQFHLEVDEPLIDRWLNVPVHKKELELWKDKFNSERISEATKQHVESAKTLSEKTFSSFINLIKG